MLLARVKSLREKFLAPDMQARLGAWWRGEVWAPAVAAPAPVSAAEPPAKASPGTVKVGIAQQLWGEGFIHPNDPAFIRDLVVRLGLNKEKTFGVLGIGLGGAARAIVEMTDVWIAGYERDPVAADLCLAQCQQAGMAKKVAVECTEYDALTLPIHKFHDMMAMLCLSAVADKARLIAQMAQAVRPGGAVLLAEFTVPEGGLAEDERVALFDADEGAAQPASVEAYAAWLAAAQLDLRVKEEVTARYLEHVTAGWSNLRRVLDHLGAEAGDADARNAMLRSVADQASLWAARIDAFRAKRLFVHRLLAYVPGHAGP